MRAGNRKRKTEGFIFPVPFAGGLVLAAALALIYVWLGCRCEDMGREIKSLENEKSEFAKQHMQEELRWMQMKSPENMESVLRKFGIRMVWPTRGQIVRVYMSAGTELAEASQSGTVRYAKK